MGSYGASNVEPCLGNAWIGLGGGWSAEEASTERKLRSRIMWLNREGGFDNAISYQKVKEAAAGLSSPQIMPILKQLEEKKEEVKDATAYACNALRNQGGGIAMPWAAFDAWPLYGPAPMK